MIRLSKPQILLLHEQLIAETGGSSGLRDEGMLDSALNTPFQTFAGKDVYPSLQQKAARLCFGLVKNHPFVDGNKRIGAHVMILLAFPGLFKILPWQMNNTFIMFAFLLICWFFSEKLYTSFRYVTLNYIFYNLPKAL